MVAFCGQIIFLQEFTRVINYYLSQDVCSVDLQTKSKSMFTTDSTMFKLWSPEWTISETLIKQ